MLDHQRVRTLIGSQGQAGRTDWRLGRFGTKKTRVLHGDPCNIPGAIRIATSNRCSEGPQGLPFVAFHPVAA